MRWSVSRILGLLFVALLCWPSLVGVSYGEPEVVEVFLTTGGCETKQRATSFSGSDEHIYCIARIKVYRHAPRSSYDVIVEWYAPDGTLYFREDFRLERPERNTTYSVCSRLAVKRTWAACLNGTWRVSVTIPFGDRKSASFTLISPENQPPTAQFSWRYLEARTLLFDATESYDEDGKIVSYSWDFGDGYQGEGATVTHQYARDGDYPVLLRINDNCGAVARVKKTVPVPSPPPPNRSPVARFTCPSQAVVGKPVTFDASGSYDPDGNIASYFWQFGDGQTDYGVSVTHQYQAAGTYTVTLTVTDNAGAKATTSRTVKVFPLSNQKPVAYFTWDLGQPNPDQTVTFDASGSYDPDGFIRAYLWDFDGDGRIDKSTTEPQVKYAFPTCGDKRVILRVVDDQGASSSPESKSLHVNCRPRAQFAWTPRVPQPGEVVQFDGGVSSDAEGQVVSYSWDFGDGSPIEYGIQVSHAYAVCGRYTVTLTVTDDRGLSHESQRVVRVNCPPVAGFERSPEVPSPGTNVRFTAVRDRSLSHDPDGTIVSYTWDFGDGTPPVTVRPPATSVTHAYAQCGSYTVTLTVTDSDGGTAMANREVRVNCPPVADFIWSPKKPNLGEDVAFDASGSYDPDGIITSYTWHFGDGTPAVTVTTPQVDHRFERYGTFTVQLTVVDADGAARTSSTQLTVEDLLPPSSQATFPPPSCQYGWYSGPVRVTVTASDNDAVAAIYYRVDGGSVRSAGGASTVVTVRREGTSTIEAHDQRADALAGSFVLPE